MTPPQYHVMDLKGNFFFWQKMKTFDHGKRSICLLNLLVKVINQTLTSRIPRLIENKFGLFGGRDGGRKK